MDMAKEMETHREGLTRFACQKLSKFKVGGQVAADLVQDAYVAAWQARDKYDASTGKEGLRAWLWQFVEFKCRDTIRRNWNRERWLEQPLLREAIDSNDVVGDGSGVVDIEQIALDNLEKDEERDRLYTLIAECASLSSCERQALLLRCVGDLSHAELGRALGVTEGAARVLWHRATLKLKEAAGAVQEDDEPCLT